LFEGGNPIVKVLFLTQIIPYPPDAGPKVKTWHVIRYLVERGHQVTLASFVRPEEKACLPALEKLCATVHTVPLHRSRLADVANWLRSQITDRPFLVERDDLAGMRALVRLLMATKPIDVIHADQLSMAQFGLVREPLLFRSRSIRGASGFSQPEGKHEGRVFQGRPALLYDAHNAVWKVLEGMQLTARLYQKPLLSLEAQRLKRYQGMVVNSFDFTLAVTASDRQALLEAAAAYPVLDEHYQPHISVIPIAVDTYQLQPLKRNPASNHILTLGTLHYPPNADGIRWFLHEVLPLIHQQMPNVRVTVVGKNPPPDFIQLAAQKPDWIEVTGYVPDLTPYLERAALMIVPVRAGGGMRVRILEAFARGMPVVTTTVGLEGIHAKPNQDILVADTPKGFAGAVVRLLEDEQLQSQLAANGRHLAETKYDWRVVLKRMDDVYLEIEHAKARSAVDSV